MEKHTKCWRGDACVTCKDLTEEDLQRLKELFENQLELELVQQEKHGQHRRSS